MLVATEQTIRLIGIDIGKNSFHIVGLDYRGVIVFRQFAHRVLGRRGSARRAPAHNKRGETRL